jgi:hypothetical protein
MKNTVNNMPVTPNSGGGGSRGGWLGKLFGMVNARSYEMLQRDRFQWQQGVITDEMSKRATNAEAAKAAGRVVGEKMSLANRRNAAFAFERKRTSKNKKTGEYNYPDLVDMGPAIDPLNARWSPGAEVQRRRNTGATGQGGGTPTTPPPGTTPPNTPPPPPSGGGGGMPAPSRNAQLDPFDNAGTQQPPQNAANADTTNLQNATVKTPKARKPRAPRTPKAGA